MCKKICHMLVSDVTLGSDQEEITLIFLNCILESTYVCLNCCIHDAYNELQRIFYLHFLAIPQGVSKLKLNIILLPFLEQDKHHANELEHLLH